MTSAAASKSWAPAAAALAALAAATALLAGGIGWRSLRLELGASDWAFIDGPWSRAQRHDVDPPAAADGVTSFYGRALRSGSTLSLPVATSGPLGLTLRARAGVRSVVAAFAPRGSGEVLVETAPWKPYRLDLPAEAAEDGAELRFALRPMPLVPGDHVERPEVLVDLVSLESASGLRLTWGAALLVAAVPLSTFAFALAVGHGSRPALVAAAAGALSALGLLRAEPFVVLAAIPRLLPAALGMGWAVHALLRQAQLPEPAPRAALAWLVALGTLVHASLVFLPNHNPPDLETHVTRVLSLRDVPLRYGDLLRYGSHLPASAQVAAPATDLFGDEVLVPYSPFPYALLYGLHSAGLDLHWAMTAASAALLMGVAAFVWVAAARLFGREAAWVAALLFSLDLAVWHHLGRARAPASFGAAGAVAALLLLACRADALTRPRTILAVSAALAAGVLGYSSLAVLFGLFGVALLALLAVDGSGLSGAQKRGVAAALVLGGGLALAVYYGHYLPGLLRGGVAGIEAEPEMFTGRTVFLVFRNEGRQSLRLWALGFGYVLLAGLAAAPFALARARPAARPVLAAWLAAWALVMVLKDPLFFPKVLRWGKEDQFVSPLLCLLVAGAVAGLRPVWARRLAGGAAVAGMLALQVRDFLLHAVSLRL